MIVHKMSVDHIETDAISLSVCSFPSESILFAKPHAFSRSIPRRVQCRNFHQQFSGLMDFQQIKFQLSVCLAMCENNIEEYFNNEFRIEVKLIR